MGVRVDAKTEKAERLEQEAIVRLSDLNRAIIPSRPTTPSHKPALTAYT